MIIAVASCCKRIELITQKTNSCIFIELEIQIIVCVASNTGNLKLAYSINQ